MRTIVGIDQHVNFLLINSVRSSTRKTYDHGMKSYCKFCEIYELRPFPPSEASVLRYIAHLDILHLRSQTIKVYIASIDHQCVLRNMDKPSALPRVKLLLRAISMKDTPTNSKLPITVDILNLMKPFVLLDYVDGAMYWAAMCVAHFGLLRVSEFTVNTNFNSLYHASFQTVVVSHKTIKIFIPRSKTDVTNKGFSISFICNGSNVCPFCALQHYLSSQPVSTSDRPLFQLSNGKALSRSLFVQKTKSVLTSLGLDKKCYSSHSFRSGGATSAAQAGLKDWELKHLGRWKSEAYHSYVKPSENMLEQLRTKLVGLNIDRDSYMFNF